jgi:outer membrane murein-binding lipoprotein Lpp
MKKWIPALLIIVLLSTLMAGCVSQKDYDAVVRERDELKTQVASLQTDLDKAKTDYANLESYHDNYKSNIDKIAPRFLKEVKVYTSFISILVTAAKLAKDVLQGNKGGALSPYYSMTNEIESAGAKFMTELESAVKEIDNAELTDKWRKFQTDEKNRDKESGMTFISVLDLLVKSTNDDIKMLETTLGIEGNNKRRIIEKKTFIEPAIVKLIK